MTCFHSGRYNILIELVDSCPLNLSENVSFLHSPTSSGESESESMWGYMIPTKSWCINNTNFEWKLIFQPLSGTVYLNQYILLIYWRGIPLYRGPGATSSGRLSINSEVSFTPWRSVSIQSLSALGIRWPHFNWWNVPVKCDDFTSSDPSRGICMAISGISSVTFWHTMLTFHELPRLALTSFRERPLSSGAVEGGGGITSDQIQSLETLTWHVLPCCKKSSTNQIEVDIVPCSNYWLTF